MSLTPAEVIRKKTLNSPQIASIVNDAIASIDQGINAICIETNKYDHQMPTDLFIPGLARANAQRIVYYHVAKQLQKAGYTVEITMKSNTVVFHIGWTCDIATTDVDKIDRFLAKLRRGATSTNPKKPTKGKKEDDLKLDDLVDFYQDT